MNDETIAGLFKELKNNPQRFLKADANQETGALLKLLGVLFRFRRTIFTSGVTPPRCRVPFHVLEGLDKKVYRDWLNRDFSGLKTELYSITGPMADTCRAMMTNLQRDGLSQMARVETPKLPHGEALDGVHQSLLQFLQTTQLEIEGKIFAEVKAYGERYYREQWSYVRRLFKQKAIEVTLNNMPAKEVQKCHGRIPLARLASLLCLMEKPELFSKALPSSLRSRYEDEMKISQQKMESSEQNLSLMAEDTLKWAELIKEHLPESHVDPQMGFDISGAVSSAVEALFNFKLAQDSGQRIETTQILRQQVLQLTETEDVQAELLIRMLWELQRANISNPEVLEVGEKVCKWAQQKYRFESKARMVLRAILGLPSKSIELGQVEVMLIFHHILNGAFEEARQRFAQLSAEYSSPWDDEIRALLG